MRRNELHANLSVSQTTLNLLRECPRCFWLHVSRGVHRPREPWPSVVRRLNEIVKTYWDRYAHVGILPPLLQGLLEGVPLVPRMEAWFDRVTGLTLVGRLDGCVRTEAYLHAPVDHKCLGSPPVAVNEGYVLQLDTYELLLEKNEYPTAGFGYLDYYIVREGTSEAGIQLDVEVRRVQTDSRRALDRLVQARCVLDSGTPPPPSPDCDHCYWASRVAEFESA